VSRITKSIESIAADRSDVALPRACWRRGKGVPEPFQSPSISTTKAYSGHEEISWYLHNNRKQLAIDSMNGPFPPQTLCNYI
jgi:hypothetical protein